MITKQRISPTSVKLLRNVISAFAICMFAFGQPVYAQEGKIAVPNRSMTLKDALYEIQRQTSYKIIVVWDELDSEKKVAFPANSMEIKDYLKHVLSDTDHTWKENGGWIAISYQSPDHSPMSRNQRTSSAMIRDDFRQTQMRFVPDPWSRTQIPFEDMVNTRVMKMGSGEAIRDSLGMAVINFRVNSSLVERDYMDNARTLDLLHRTFTDKDVLANMDYVVLTAGSSPEGNTTANETLAEKRVLAMKSYIMWKYPFLNRDIIYTFSIGEDWSGLHKMVEEDYAVPNRNEALRILGSHSSGESKRQQLKALEYGRTYKYISENMLTDLRGATACTIHYKPEPEPKIIVEKDTVYIEKIVEREILVEPQPLPEIKPEVVFHKKPLFAIKTNLLFDVATMLNLELEVPIGNRFSIAGEYIFPWWLWEDDQYCLQARVGSLEGRYWFGNREKRVQMTGWFAGVYAGGGTYDIEWGDKGYQGTRMISAGFTGGYVHSISKNNNWRMEYSLGIGYMNTNYDEYIPRKGLDNEWHLIRQKSTKYTWFGPTKAKVSLVWMINHKQQIGGVR